MAMSRSARRIRGHGSISASGTCSIRSARAKRRRRHVTAYRIPSGRRRSLHQIPVGPVHAGIIEPGHFRFTAGGETVVRLEERLGYVHKGIESLMAGAPIEQAARLAARTSGDSTVAYGIAFAHAVEAALNIEAAAARAILAGADGGTGAAGEPSRRYRRDLQRRVVFADARALRHLARACAARGRRCIRPSADDGSGGARRRRRRSRSPTACLASARLVWQIQQRFPRLIELYDNTASLQDRTAATGILRAELAQQFGASGYVGRASGRNVDARKIARLRALRSARPSPCRC